jgi:serine/threonine protein kinase
MATVYLAHDLRHDRPVALKVLHPELASSLGPDRFLREIRLSARLQHPHILPVLDSGDAAGQLWFAMPFVDGGTLRQRLSQEKQLPIAEAVRIAREWQTRSTTPTSRA